MPPQTCIQLREYEMALAHTPVLLDELVELTVHEAEDRMPLEKGHAYVARGDHHLRVERTSGVLKCRVTQDELASGHRPSVDVLFESVARQVGPLRCVLAHSFGASMSLYAQRDWGLATDKLVLISSFEHCVWFTEAFGECMGLSSSVLEEVRQKLVERHCGRLNWSRLSVLDMLRDSQGQALVIHDEDDAEIPFEHGLALARVSPRTEFLATRGYGHHRVLRRNDVIRRIVQFISA